jgi:hypothetical protein
MNSIPKFIASIAALIASLALAWIAFSASKAGINVNLNADMAYHKTGF